jgi:hypothetical protein
VRTANFVVRAATLRLAQVVADAAEYQRKKQALRWLDHELPPWKEPMPVKVTITGNQSNSYTSFKFEGDQVQSTGIHLEGPLDHILATTLPHEMTHTVLAYHFRTSIPRWADEGAAMLSEDAESQIQHVQALQRLLKDKATYPLKRLFSFRDYPKNVLALHAQGHSVTNFLVERKDRATFLSFLKQGMNEDWDKALQRHYNIASVEELEKAWLASVRRNEEPAKEAPRIEPYLHVGPQPIMALALRRAEGAILLRIPTSYYQPVTTMVQETPDSEWKPVTTYRLVHGEKSAMIDLERTEAFDTSGKAIERKALTDLLKKETPVLVATDGKKVDPFYLRVVKEGTVVLVPPANFRGEPGVQQVFEERVARPPRATDRERR